MEKIIDIILEFVEPENEITADSNLRNDCGLTSFDSVCLLDRLCEEFEKDVDEKKLRECHTVRDLAELFIS
ncbi:MAG: acyl carrier protein [Oscillospiraceae bacterium]|nr:acyl carrier protein [Oscillospiraceae bacterium]